MTRTEIQTIINNIADGVPNTALKVRTALNAIADGTAISYQVVELDVPTSYITANFDPTGLGINERLGWAICNGNNGTRDRSGRVSIQYSTTYPTLGALGGSKDAVAVYHSHKTISSTGTVVPHSTSNNFYNQGQTWSDSGAIDEKYSGIAFEGESGANKNMQPYIVSLFIMKLP